ncbi:MAG: cbb3-type cytochrome c oxidase subunit II [Rhodospirillales bacterium]|nr:cbb3-type cytochrome c oxidase subunit II [Rhodospirillales bacterium]
MNSRTVALISGFLFLTLAAFTQGVLPMLEPQSRSAKVTKVVRTNLGELKWMEAKATDYTAKQALGRKVYIREGCWYCHSQFVRPVTGETRRWGPVSQAGEYAFDVPHLFSTRRIGPDLTRVGLKYSDEWHLAHFWNPRMVVPDSIMPRFAELFDAPEERVPVVDGDAGVKTLARTAASEAMFDFSSKEKIQLTPNADGLLFVPERGKNPVIFTPNKEFTGASVRLAAVTPELEGLVAYIQKLGTNRGKWRDRFEPQLISASQVSMPLSEEWIGHGKQVYERRCLGCHGVKGDGNGPAATFMHAVRPRDFTLGVFKFHLTPSGSMPTDGDLLRTITQGIRGTAMPTWHMLSEKDRLSVIQYIKYVLAADRSDPKNPYLYFIEEPPKPPVYIGQPPAPSESLVARGGEVWLQAKCWECHGEKGRGDGTKAVGLMNDFGYPIPPANLTTGQFKSGPLVQDIFRTVTNGLRGTPMPSYAKPIAEADRWALAYYILSLSAYTDPLTGEKLNISAEDRAALNDPGLKASTSSQAYAPPQPSSSLSGAYGGDAWAGRKGMEIVKPGSKPKPTAQVKPNRKGKDDG